MIAIRSSCACSSAVALDHGRLVCGSCGAAVASVAHGHVYTTNPEEWPPGARSRRHARDMIRRVAGHEQVGQGRATAWRVGVLAYDHHYGRRHPASAPAPCGEDDTDIDAWVTSSGYRLARR